MDRLLPGLGYVGRQPLSFRSGPSLGAAKTVSHLEASALAPGNSE